MRRFAIVNNVKKSVMIVLTVWPTLFVLWTGNIFGKSTQTFNHRQFRRSSFSTLRRLGVKRYYRLSKNAKNDAGCVRLSAHITWSELCEVSVWFAAGTDKKSPESTWTRCKGSDGTFSSVTGTDERWLSTLGNANKLVLLWSVKIGTVLVSWLKVLQAWNWKIVLKWFSNEKNGLVNI